MDIEQIRKDFEAHNEAWIHLYTGNDRREDGEYLSTDLEVAWKDWQAAHAHYAKPAAPVALPEPVARRYKDKITGLHHYGERPTFQEEYQNTEPLYTEQQVRELLEANGIAQEKQG